MSRSRKKAGRGALVIMALFLAASGALRIGAGVGVALANSEVPTEETTTPPSECLEMPAAIAKALLEREGSVSAREAAITDKEAALTLAKAVIDRRIEEMTSVEEELKKTMQLADGAAEADLTRLTAVYEAMKPKDTAKIFGNMAPEFAAGFLGRMDPDAAAAVLAGMDSEAAYAISVLIAGRNALVPKN